MTSSAPTVEAIRIQKMRKLPSRPFQKPVWRRWEKEARKLSGRVEGPREGELVGCAVV